MQPISRSGKFRIACIGVMTASLAVLCVGGAAIVCLGDAESDPSINARVALAEQQLHEKRHLHRETNLILADWQNWDLRHAQEQRIGRLREEREAAQASAQQAYHRFRLARHRAGVYRQRSRYLAARLFATQRDAARARNQARQRTQQLMSSSVVPTE